MSASVAATSDSHLSFDAIELRQQLDHMGSAIIPQLLPSTLCTELRYMYSQDSLFRSKIVMAQHHFGRGEYKYFANPLPPLVMELRRCLYMHLAPIANQWHQHLQCAAQFPGDLADFTRLCHAAGQTRPTALLLRYARNDYNCLHQDLYGALVFPLQVAILLSQPGRDFTGGEFVLTEQRPRMQAKVEVMPLQQGDAVVFAVNQRPVPGGRGGFSRAKLRHGVSRIREGERFTLGLIFHDAT